MSPGVRAILQRIVDEVGSCRDGKCDCHYMPFGQDALEIARAELAEEACAGCAQGMALCMDVTASVTRKYHMTSNGVAVAHTEK